MFMLSFLLEFPLNIFFWNFRKKTYSYSSKNYEMPKKSLLGFLLKFLLVWNHGINFWRKRERFLENFHMRFLQRIFWKNSTKNFCKVSWENLKTIFSDIFLKSFRSSSFASFCFFFSGITRVTLPDQAIYSGIIQERSSKNFQNIPVLFLIEFVLRNYQEFFP